jgi:hypothetical protein
MFQAKIFDSLSYFPHWGIDYSTPSPLEEVPKAIGREGGKYPAKLITFYLFYSY